MLNTKKIIGVFLLLSIFIFAIGTSFASEVVENSSYMSNTDSIINEQLDDLSVNNIQDNLELSNNDASDYLSNSPNVFANPDFEEGTLDEEGNVYGWNVSTNGGHSKYDRSRDDPYGQIVSDDPEEIFEIDGNALFIEASGDNIYYISQYIDFTSIKSINFYCANPTGSTTFTFSVGGESISTQTCQGSFSKWQNITIDFSNKNLVGVKLFEISFENIEMYMLFDKFRVIYDDKLSSNFEYVPTVNNDNISVQFTNKAKGTFNSVFWDFGDRTNSTDINPTKIFAPGEYNVTLTVFNNDANDTYSQILSLIYPTIDGKMYASVQDAINNTVDGATIEIPNDITEDLNINHNLTLNFNGNKLNGNINVNDGAIVTVNNISDVSSVSTDDSSKLTIIDSNINSNLELKAGNIDINGVNFNDSVLTITFANATLVNVNVANGGIVVNGGKSKITNSNLTGSNVAISQTAGELEITNNIIKDNVKGIEITGGNATITFNAIYNNTNAFNATGATVTSTNNWYGTNTVTGINQYLRLVLTADTAKMYPGEKYLITVDLTQNSDLESTLSEGSLNTLTLEFTSPNGEVTPVTINKGKGTFEFTAGAISEDVKFTLFGEEYELEDATSIVAKPLATNITITSSEKGVVIISLTTAEGNVSGATIKYIINGVNSTNLTDANGQIIIKGLSGKITINATFEGNETLLISNNVANFDFTEPTVDNKTNPSQPTVIPSKTPTSTKIVKVASKITAKKKTFKAKTKTKKYQITLKTKSGKAIKKVKVTLKVKGKTYKATTNSKGKATFKITKLTKKGKYTAVIKFAGNKNYKATSKKVKLTVKK